MRQIKTLLVLTAVATLLALPAAAADNGFYLGLSAGQAELNTGDLGTTEVEGNANAYKLFAGYRFLNFLAVEGAYVDLGSAEDDQEGTSTHYEADVNGFELQGMAFLPLGIADIFVKAGLFNWNADLEGIIAGEPDSVSADGTDPVYGAGFQLRFKSFAVRAEVEYFDVEKANDVYMYSIGASYTF
ncbi:MAG: outer membrane beta-barrel protein [Thermoanaerobaculaceae bacterium]|nr:outer membrane beta-barrel protein [Thermoanaerobaculaceae bacterium]